MFQGLAEQSSASQKLNYRFSIYFPTGPAETVGIFFGLSHLSKYELKSPQTNSQHNIGFDVAKCAAQLLYGPVIVMNYLKLLRSAEHAEFKIKHFLQELKQFASAEKKEK